MDISQREGKYPPPTGSSTILGVEFSGTIAEVHPGVSGWNVNDEVLGLAGGVSNSWLTLRVIADCTLNQGAYAEYIAVNQTHIIAKPPYLTWVEAASIPEVFLTGEWD